ncbi:hypothetical protein ACIQCN_03075 [Pseudarthrobacter sp. NPDC092424]|uniref:hypothetical protein n=1 Tax=Pseudarthrobacter sp. NPDC092424 TaxID=3364415 RepID=UPI0038090078
MDSIRNLVAGADPLGHGPATPDAEQALSAMLLRPDIFADRVSADIPTLAERRRARARVFGAVTLAAAAVAAGVLVATNLVPTAAPAPASKPVATQSASASASAAPAPSARVSAPPAPAVDASSVPSRKVVVPMATPAPAPTPIGWERYSNQSAGVAFDLPPGWAVIEHSVDGAVPSVRLDVQNEQGAKVASLIHAQPGGLGGACGPEAVPLLTLDSEPVTFPYRASEGAAAPEFSYRVLDGTGSGLRVNGSLGLSQPDLHATEACMYYNTVSSPVGTLSFASQFQVNLGGEGLVFSSVAEAKAYMATGEYAQLKRMMVSLDLTL